MPHLRIEYTANLEPEADMAGLCTALAAVLATLENEQGTPLFPLAGTRVMAFPAAHFAVADGHPGRAFIYLTMRIAPGRSDALKKMACDAVLACASAHLDAVFATRALGMTLHMDEQAPVQEGKRNNLGSYLQS